MDPDRLFPGLGPGFDQLGVVIALVVFASAGLWLFKTWEPNIWGDSRSATVRLRRFCGNE